MISAFGVDHGEVSKAFPMTAFARTSTRSAGLKTGKLMGQAGRGMQRAGAGMAAKPGILRPQVGGAMQRTGLGMRRAGVSMGRNPMRTGFGVAGAAGAGGTAGGVGLSNRLQQRQRRTF